MPATPVITKYAELYDVQALGDDEIIVLEGGTPVVKHLSDLAAFETFAGLSDVPAGNGLWARESGALVWKSEASFDPAGSAAAAQTAAEAYTDTQVAAEATTRAAGDVSAVGTAAGLALVLGGL